MKKLFAAILCAVMLCMAMLMGCGELPPEYVFVVADDEVVYRESSVASSSFGGLGVEWGVYEDTNKLVSGAWEKQVAVADRLNPRLVRCMMNFEWVVTDYDNHGTDDPDDDTWAYDFDNKYMKNACDILDFCEDRNIKVAFGVWSVIGSANEAVDVWKMIPNATSDKRWAMLAADLMDYLVNVKGYSCIKWFVSTNEPNYKGAYGSSKNYYNTYEKWEQGVKNVRAAFDAIGLTELDIVGGDTTGFNGSEEYLTGIADGLADKVNNYGVHLYISNNPVDKGTFKNNLEELINAVKAKDSAICDTKPFYIWEAGMQEGKNNATDCQGLITNFSYGRRMADYTVQSVLAGTNGIAYWDFDDAMHFMYTDGGSNAKEWGMFSTLASAPADMQELRPWYHSSVLLTNLLQDGNVVYAPTAVESDSFRSLATVSADGKRGGFVAINAGRKAITKKFRLEKTVDGSGKLYVYLYSASTLKLGEDGFVTYNYVIDGSLNNFTELEIPAGCVAVVSSEVL